MTALPAFPVPGSIIEFIEDGQIQTAFVIEESSGKLRLLLQNRRETKLGSNRVLPWIGPLYPPVTGKDEAARLVEKHKGLRQQKAALINCEEVWSISEGEVKEAPASWFAELFETDPGIDTIAAYGNALLEAKTWFRFLNPDFLVFDAETVQKRTEEKAARAFQEKLAGEGSSFLRLLWEIATKKRIVNGNDEIAKLAPAQDLSEKLENLLFERMINPDSTKDDDLWRRLIHSLPESPFLAIQLLEAWGKIPRHYNFWLDRADYNPKDSWWKKDNEEVDRLANITLPDSQLNLNISSYPYVSIDGESTKDIDDAFFLEKEENGWHLILAFANPGLYWQFDTNLDKKVARRATSLYLPEGVLHMLPPVLGENAFSLLEKETRPALCLDLRIDETGGIKSCSPFIAAIRLSANLRYAEVQKILENQDDDSNRAHDFLGMLQESHILAQLLEKRRIEQGAIIMDRPEPEITLQGDGDNIEVILKSEQSLPDAKRIVTEMMVLASYSFADWASKNRIPLIYRTQKISVPREYAGIWSKPEDLAKIARVLMPSILETQPGFHAALGMPRYAPVTSPLRRYTDLVNENQIVTFLTSGKARLEEKELAQLLSQFSLDLENSVHVQKFRPRYWKLLYFKQQGEKKWWPAVITDENEYYFMLTLPDQGLFVKGKRQLFEERAMPGMKVQVRLGKVDPLFNEIQALEAILE